jgi:hypothetical protein
VLAVPGHGNLVVTGGLPNVGPNEQLGEAFKTWFNRMYMRVRGHRCIAAVVTVEIFCLGTSQLFRQTCCVTASGVMCGRVYCFMALLQRCAAMSGDDAGTGATVWHVLCQLP